MRFLLLLMLAGASLPVMAEVADKLPGYGDQWLVAIVATAVCSALTWWRPALWVVGLLVTVVLGWGMLDIVLDPAMRSAVIAELGMGYLFSGFSAASAVTLVPLLVAMLRRRHNKM